MSDETQKFSVDELKALGIPAESLEASSVQQERAEAAASQAVSKVEAEKISGREVEVGQLKFGDFARLDTGSRKVVDDIIEDVTRQQQRGEYRISHEDLKIYFNEVVSVLASEFEQAKLEEVLKNALVRDKILNIISERHPQEEIKPSPEATKQLQESIEIWKKNLEIYTQAKGVSIGKQSVAGKFMGFLNKRLNVSDSENTEKTKLVEIKAFLDTLYSQGNINKEQLNRPVVYVDDRDSNNGFQMGVGNVSDAITHGKGYFPTALEGYIKELQSTPRNQKIAEQIFTALEWISKGYGERPSTIGEDKDDFTGGVITDAGGGGNHSLLLKADIHKKLRVID